MRRQREEGEERNGGEESLWQEREEIEREEGTGRERWRGEDGRSYLEKKRCKERKERS